MAKQTSILQFRGRLGDLVGYKLKNIAQPIARTIDPNAGERIKNDIRFTDFRLYNGIYGMMGCLAGYFIGGIVNFTQLSLKSYSSAYLTRWLSKRCEFDLTVGTPNSFDVAAYADSLSRYIESFGKFSSLNYGAQPLEYSIGSSGEIQQMHISSNGLISNKLLYSGATNILVSVTFFCFINPEGQNDGTKFVTTDKGKLGTVFTHQQEYALEDVISIDIDNPIPGSIYSRLRSCGFVVVKYLPFRTDVFGNTFYYTRLASFQLQTFKFQQ